VVHVCWALQETVQQGKGPVPSGNHQD